MQRSFTCQKTYQCDLRSQQSRNAYGEFWMQGLVPKQLHSDNYAEAAACGSYTQQGRFRNTPYIFYGFALVGKHKQ